VEMKGINCSLPKAACLGPGDARRQAGRFRLRQTGPLALPGEPFSAPFRLFPGGFGRGCGREGAPVSARFHRFPRVSPLRRRPPDTHRLAAGSGLPFPRLSTPFPSGAGSGPFALHGCPAKGPGEAGTSGVVPTLRAGDRAGNRGPLCQNCRGPMTLGRVGSLAPTVGGSAWPPRTSGARPYCQGGPEVGSLEGTTAPGGAHLLTVSRCAPPRGASGNVSRCASPGRRASKIRVWMRAAPGRRIFKRLKMRLPGAHLALSARCAPPLGPGEEGRDSHGRRGPDNRPRSLIPSSPLERGGITPPPCSWTITSGLPQVASRFFGDSPSPEHGVTTKGRRFGPQAHLFGCGSAAIGGTRYEVHC
jgi:hypothetical protein